MIKEAQVWDALPSHGFLRSYVEYASHCTDANIAFHVAGGLSCLTQCAPIDYAVPYTSPLYGTMYSMVVGASSRSRKTASLNIAQRIIREAIPDSVVETPGSQEGLYEGLRHNPRQLVLFPEWGEFLAKAEEGYMMPVKTALTNVWDCLDEATEILTPQGWKGRGEVKVGDECYSLNTATGLLEVVPVLDYGERPVREGERMFVLKGNRSDIRTTEGHRFCLHGSLDGGTVWMTGAEWVASQKAMRLPLPVAGVSTPMWTNIDIGTPTLEPSRPGEVVWCISNRNETIVTRRNGRVAIIGNCLPTGRALAKKRDGIIEKPRLSIFCAIATDLLERHTEQADWTGGFLARFLTFYAEPEREFPTPPIDDVEERLRMVRWLEGLADPRIAPGRSLWLDAQAQEVWQDWYETLRPLISGSSKRASAACSRASAIAAKIALLLAWDIGEARSGGPWSVGLKELEPSLKLTNLHLESVLELGERVTGTRDMRDRSLVLRAIGMQPTPLGWILREAEMLKRRAKEVLESLVEEKAIAEVKINNQLYYKQTPDAHSLLAQAVLQARIDEADTQGALAATSYDANTGSEQRLAQVIGFAQPEDYEPAGPTAVDTQYDDAAYWASYNGE